MAEVTVPKGTHTKRFGNKATLAGKDDVRNGNIINPAVPPKIADMYWGMALQTLQRWSDDGNHKLVRPRTLIAVEDVGLYLDQVCDVVDLVEGLEWEQRLFNLSGYRDFVYQAIRQTCEWWAGNDFDRFLYVTQDGVEETDSKAE